MTEQNTKALANDLTAIVAAYASFIEEKGLSEEFEAWTSREAGESK